MINNMQKKKLMDAWGDKAESLACNAEVRLYDPLSSWQCFIYALNPEDEDEVKCILQIHKNAEAILESWFLKDIKSLFNENGESVIVDDEYRQQRAAELFKRLNQGTYGNRY